MNTETAPIILVINANIICGHITSMDFVLVNVVVPIMHKNGVCIQYWLLWQWHQA